MEPEPYIKTIEWEMMNKRKFFPLSMLSQFSIRCALFPLTLIKTQLQVQFRNDAYNGMADAFVKIYKREGVAGLYRGFFINSFQIVSGVFYLSTYEKTRHFLTEKGYNKNVKAIVSGAMASLAGQTIIVPFDIISQHIMVLGMDINGRNINPLNINISKQNKSRLALLVAKEIMKKDGFLGFYRGYGASLLAYVPNSALWWAFYQLYQDELLKVMPYDTSHLFIQCIAGSFGGFTTTLITNPLDIVRARMQVQRLESFVKAANELWFEERMGMFFKGLSARLVQSAVFSFSVILGYETIKRISIEDEYKHLVRW